MFADFAVDIGVSQIAEGQGWNFPFVKIYKRGSEKGRGDSVNLNVRPPKFQGDRMVPDQVLEIIEKVMIMAAPEPGSLENEPEISFDDEDEGEGGKEEL